MGGWVKILINYSLESPQYCRGVSHTPALYKPKLTSILIKEIPRFSNPRLYKSTTQNLIGNSFIKNGYDQRSTATHSVGEIFIIHFSLLLLEPKSNQNASAHLRWLFAQSSAHG